MKSSVTAMYLGTKVTEFESNRYLKVYLAALPDPDDRNVSGLDIMICSADVENMFEYEQLQPQKNYEFKIKVLSGSQNKIAVKILGIKKPAATAKAS